MLSFFAIIDPISCACRNQPLRGLRGGVNNQSCQVVARRAFALPLPLFLLSGFRLQASGAGLLINGENELLGSYFIFNFFLFIF